jgi:hypothetical protein
MPYPGGMANYRAICERVVVQGYDGFRLDGDVAGPSTYGIADIQPASGPPVA